MRIISVLLLMTAVSAQAEYGAMYQCETSGGSKVFQDHPCDKDRPKVTIDDRDKNTVDKPLSIDCRTGKCNTEKAWQAVQMVCPKLIENMATVDYKWTNGFSGLKFKPSPTYTTRPTVVRYFGDSIMMQNGFGAWSNVVYSCDVDVITGQVVDVKAVKGRLH